MRGLLSGLGIVLPQKVGTIRRERVHLFEDLPGPCNTVAADAITDLGRPDARITEYDRHIAHCTTSNADGKRLMRLSGIGPTTASALVAIGALRARFNGTQHPTSTLAKRAALREKDYEKPSATSLLTFVGKPL